MEGSGSLQIITASDPGGPKNNMDPDQGDSNQCGSGSTTIIFNIKKHKFKTFANFSNPYLNI
jgi:hypothetical protein